MATKTLEVQAPESPGSQKKTKLGTFIRRIATNLKDSFLNTINAGLDFDVIERDKLYTDHDHASFKEFVETEYAGLFENPYKTARSWIQIAQRYQAILANKPEETDVPLPTSISQIRPLLGYEPQEAAPIYWDAATLLYKSKGRVSGEDIDKFRRGAIDIEPVKSRAGNGSVETPDVEPSDMDFSTPEATTATEEKPRTLAYTEALDKIGALETEGVLPPNSRHALENDLIRVSERHLEEWNEINPERFKKIARLIFNAALAFEDAKKLLNQYLTDDDKVNQKEIEEKMRLIDFVYLAYALGGRGAVKVRNYTVSAEPIVK